MTEYHNIPTPSISIDTGKRLRLRFEHPLSNAQVLLFLEQYRSVKNMFYFRFVNYKKESVQYTFTQALDNYQYDKCDYYMPHTIIVENRNG